MISHLRTTRQPVLWRPAVVPVCWHQCLLMAVRRQRSTVTMTMTARTPMTICRKLTTKTTCGPASLPSSNKLASNNNVTLCLVENLNCFIGASRIGHLHPFRKIVLLYCSRHVFVDSSLLTKKLDNINNDNDNNKWYFIFFRKLVFVWGV